MKIHYTNILLFPLKLNILVNTHKKPHTTARHTQKIPTTRSLSECELYMSNYDNDPEMKRVMQKFHDRTTQRFQEYDERLQEKQQICKDKCDKEIQKIILKDKIEKELNEKFAILQTDIHSDAIPTCICEKSLADKVEKGCLRCGVVFGGGVMPGFGAIGGTALYALNQWKPAALLAATKYAMTQGAAAGIQAGKKAVIEGLKLTHINILVPDIYEQFSSATHYNHIKNFAQIIIKNFDDTCTSLDNKIPATCRVVGTKIGIYSEKSGTPLPASDRVSKVLELLAGKGETTAKAFAETESTRIVAEITEQQTAVINATYSSWQIAITASVIAIVVIVLIMVIIYLILRYRRKKKMKKKLQYIKLLEE
ncbi:rifin [Plasmodium falciparum IGH-CR14]|uniref:Rifin n=1 Tax=Plasmodium falciparum IGH-CR14 TaxID=580059 RepID=A0A0L1I779_PLAFA|nr:rifin [Plasmodium falciparum IGH-CR14]